MQRAEVLFYGIGDDKMGNGSDDKVDNAEVKRSRFRVRTCKASTWIYQEWRTRQLESKES